MMMMMVMMVMIMVMMMMMMIIKHRTQDYLPLDVVDVVDSSGPSNKNNIFKKKSIDKEDNRNNENRKENCSELFKFILKS